MVCVVLVTLGGLTPGLAVSDDFGGSFEPAAPGGVPAPPPPVPAGGGDFGGSFDDNGTVPPVDNGGDPPPPTPPIGGNDFDDKGSFDPPGPVDDIIVVPTPTPPNPPPTPPPPPPPGPQVDPQIAAFELRDFGVPPTPYLRPGQFHAPTPTAVPGANTLSTEALAQAVNGGVRLILIDVLGGQYSLPGAQMAPAMASPGSFSDQIQRQTVTWLGQISGGDSAIPIVIFCSGPECWLSYNAALRAVAAGYTNVYWYRGGLDAWQMAGLPLRPAGF